MSKRLSEEDRVLWTLVARSATPIKGRRALELPLPAEPKPEPKAAEPATAGPLTPRPAAPQPRKEPPPRHLDAVTMDKLAKGRLPIEGRVDLHGLTQEQAHPLLLSFLRRAQAAGVRYVMVITGKGPGGEGVLRRAVPAWLATPPFRALVSSHDIAARHHGGSGALYLRVRKLKEPSGSGS